MIYTIEVFRNDQFAKKIQRNKTNNKRLRYDISIAQTSCSASATAQQEEIHEINSYLFFIVLLTWIDC